MEPMYISFVSLRVSDSMWIQEAPPPDKTKSTKTTATLGDEKPTLANQWGEGKGRSEGGGGLGGHRKAIQTHCKTQPFSILTPHSSPPICAQERGNDETVIFKKQGRRLCKTIAKPQQNQHPPQQNQPRQAQKDEIQEKNRLRWTASPFSMVASKLGKLKIVPPNRRQYFCIPRFSKKKIENWKNISSGEFRSQCHAKSHHCRTNFRTSHLWHGKQWFP